MYIGHINLTTSFNGVGEHLVRLIEALHDKGITQHVIVSNVTLAKQLDIIDDVVVGPVVRSAVSANCLMPRVDLVHIHDAAAGQAGLLMTLTRSIPFVLTHREPALLNKNPLTRTIYRRAAGIICQDESDMAVLHHYNPSLRVHVVPDVGRSGSAAEHLRVYQNSQRKPIAGSSGIQ